jgi:hypothetical protein
MSNTTNLPPTPWVPTDEKLAEDWSEYVVYDADGSFVLEVLCENAASVMKLAAAAPELLEAAKDVCGLLFSLDNVPDDHPAYQRLKEAINKATT